MNIDTSPPNKDDNPDKIHKTIKKTNIYMPKSKITSNYSEEMKSLRKLQRFFKVKLFQKRFQGCFNKRIRRGDVINYEKQFNLKEVGLLEESPLKMKPKEYEEKKNLLRQKKKMAKDPYKKDIIEIRKLKHLFNAKEPAKIKVLCFFL